MHHPKPNKTGSLALRITHVYSIFAAYTEGSSRAGAIKNVCVCVCVSVHICMFPVGSTECGEPLWNSYRKLEEVFHLWKTFTLPYKDIKFTAFFSSCYLLMLLMWKCFYADGIYQYEKFHYMNEMVVFSVVTAPLVLFKSKSINPEDFTSTA